MHSEINVPHHNKNRVTKKRLLSSQMIPPTSHISQRMVIDQPISDAEDEETPAKSRILLLYRYPIQLGID